jgi:hypothetical protein
VQPAGGVSPVEKPPPPPIELPRPPGQMLAPPPETVDGNMKLAVPEKIVDGCRYQTRNLSEPREMVRGDIAAPVERVKGEMK